ncbi:MAG: hypothetical protein QXT64_08405 [Desulfurococcaceae archaeon]
MCTRSTKPAKASAGFRQAHPRVGNLAEQCTGCRFAGSTVVKCFYRSRFHPVAPVEVDFSRMNQ